MKTIRCLLMTSAVLFAVHVGTGQKRYKVWGWKVLKWTLLAAFCFFAVLIAERIG